MTDRLQRLTPLSLLSERTPLGWSSEAKPRLEHLFDGKIGKVLFPEKYTSDPMATTTAAAPDDFMLPTLGGGGPPPKPADPTIQIYVSLTPRTPLDSVLIYYGEGSNASPVTTEIALTVLTPEGTVEECQSERPTAAKYIMGPGRASAFRVVFDCRLREVMGYQLEIPESWFHEMQEIEAWGGEVVGG